MSSPQDQLTLWPYMVTQTMLQLVRQSKVGNKRNPRWHGNVTFPPPPTCCTHSREPDASTLTVILR